MHQSVAEAVRSASVFIRRSACGSALAAALLATSALGAAGDTLTVASTSPAARLLTAHVNSAVTVTFDEPIVAATVTADSFQVFGRWSGPAEGALSVAPDQRSITLVPSDPFSAGETVFVTLSEQIEAASGVSLAGGFAFHFWTRAQAATLSFKAIASMTTRTSPGESSRAYGGIASDLDNDGHLDLTIVNEDTADLRVFLNQGDGSGSFDAFIQPTFPVGRQASPSEPGDFNNDGVVDICVANIFDDTVSILLGVGDGTFLPQQLIAVGDAPRGIAVLDVDGDGDSDIVNTNFNDGNLSLLLNDGTGVFGAPSFFDGGVSGERALAAADMNEDGHMDLVVGARNTQQVAVLTGNGDGTFTFASAGPCGGAVWMLVCGDVNGDGHEDVATANSSSDNGAILLGDGRGNLAAPLTVTTDSFPIATDLADLDGDGDLDWVTSSFSGDFLLFANDGRGGFTVAQELPAPSAASCSLTLDFDNDGDLDLALIDEIADVIILMQNTSVPCPADLDASGDVSFSDLLSVLAGWGPCRTGVPCPVDLDGSGAVDFSDLLTVLAAWGPCVE